ncbi:MAG: hypothetical protein N3B13_08510, partial [Deltaproteobacteria bacterium]|nr:hypothetical protein [Deltaproteobacteria bacterium]
LVLWILYIQSGIVYSDEIQPNKNSVSEKKTQIIFYEIKPENSFSRDISNILTDVLSAEIINNGKFDLKRINDVTLKTELEKSGITGCIFPDECLTFYLNAGGFDYFIYGSALAIGENYGSVINVVNVKEGKLVLREAIVTGKNISDFISKNIQIISKFLLAEKKDGSISSVAVLNTSQNVIEQDLKISHSINGKMKAKEEGGLVKYILLGCGVVSLGLGGLFVYNADVSNTNYRKGENPGFWEERLSLYNTLALTSFLIGGALIVGSGVMFYMDYEKDKFNKHSDTKNGYYKFIVSEEVMF